MNETPGTLFQRAFELHRRGYAQEALAAYEQLLQRWPSHAEALHHSGLLLAQTGRLDDAVLRIERSLKSKPRAAEAWSNLALVFQAQRRFDEAIGALNEALRHGPHNSAILNNLAGVLLAAGRPADAESAAQRALKLDSNNATTLFNLALCHQAQGRMQEAVASADRALRADPAAVGPAGLKAQIEESLGQLDSAGATLAAALARRQPQPADAPLLFQHAHLEERQGRIGNATQLLEQVLQLDANFAPALSELLFLRKQLADWRGLDVLRARFRAGVAAGQSALSPFCLLSDPSTRAEQRLCAQQWCATQPSLTRPQRKPALGILRIGYVSADFRQHATGVLAAGLFEAHDRKRCSVFGYSTGANDGSVMRARLEAGFDRFVDAHGWAAGKLATQIAADGVDILVDLNGHANGTSTPALALRPAPIQVNYLGYPGTMGASFIDYLIGDAVVTPFAHAPDYSETLVQLPGSYQINDRSRTIVEAPGGHELGLPDDTFVFCSFNQAYKLNPEVFDAWARILIDVPKSVLWLLGAGANSTALSIEENIRREAGVRGIDPARVVFAARRPFSEYLGLYRHADLFLDTWPYNAHTTASDALWVGCPVLTWLGETFAGRVAASLLTAVGLPELIAADVESYVDRAKTLASNGGELARYRLHLSTQGRASALFDTAATTHALELAYETMAEQSRSGVREALRIEFT